ncbi:hypothetical protein ACI2LC_34870 [Nonomuraea wenchangensis]|uniref:hypothetical protein n=1 Tax=Nonomuraea wenchangensis TaxID=568860 RepID=UPI00340D2A40
MSPEQTPNEHYDLDVLRAAFPAWSLFRSDAGVFYATRRGVHLRDADVDKGLRQTVSANDAEVFVSLLQDQTRMAVGP